MNIRLSENNIVLEMNEYFGTQLPVRVMRFTDIDCNDEKMKQLKQQILNNQAIVEKINQKIKSIENNITGADARLHPQIYKVAMNVLSNLKEIMKTTEHSGGISQ